MRKEMIENAAFEVATQVRAVEDSIDAALTEIAELQARMMRVNAVAGDGLRDDPRRHFNNLRPPPAGWSKPAAQSSPATRRWPMPRARFPGCAPLRGGEGECPPATGTAHLKIVA